jgi:hypothetical protein
VHDRTLAKAPGVVTTEPEKETGGKAQGEDSDAEEDRPTVTPPFDPVAFAQEVLGGKPSPLRGSPAVTPPSERDALTPSNAHGPHSRKPLHGVDHPTPIGSRSRRPTPRGLLSLANARIPSDLPHRNQGSNAFGASDREWQELETSPPPPLQQVLIDRSSQSDPPKAKDAPDLPAATAATAAAAQPMCPAPPSGQEMNDRVSLGDYTGALEIAEKLLEINPDDRPVKVCAESCRGVLRQMYAARIGPLDRVPMVMVARDQLRWLSIDHRAGFVLSLIDGVSSLEMILDVGGMPELDALRILSELAQQRIISFR